MAKDSMYKPVESCMGIVEYCYEGKKTPCSGSMIFAGEKALIATAAHCIYDWKSKTFYDEIFFKPYILHMKKRYKLVATLLLVITIGLVGCSSDDYGQQLSKLKAQKVIIDYNEEQTVLEDDAAGDFVALLDVETWEVKSKSYIDDKELIIECNLYEGVLEEATQQIIERNVATIYFYDNNAAMFKTGRLQMYFKISDNTIDEIKTCTN